MVHLGEEIAGIIKMHAAPARQPASSATILTAHKIPLDQTLVRVLKLLAVSGLASFFVCVCLTSGLAFCYHAGNSLQCLQSPASTSLRTLTRVLTNPVYFPLTTSTVIPIILLIASNQTLFEKSESRGVSRKAGWRRGARRFGKRPPCHRRESALYMRWHSHDLVKTVLGYRVAKRHDKSSRPPPLEVTLFRSPYFVDRACQAMFETV